MSSRYFSSFVLTSASADASLVRSLRAKTLKSRLVRRSVPSSQSIVGLISLKTIGF